MPEFLFNKNNWLRESLSGGLSPKPDRLSATAGKPLFCFNKFVSARRRYAMGWPVQWITPDNRRRCPDFDAAPGVHAVRPPVRNASRPALRVRELLKIIREPYWRMNMELLLILPAAFFAAVLWCTGARLFRLLVAAAAKRRIPQIAATGRAVSD